MFPIDIKSTKPLYEQIIDYIKEQTLRGNLKPADKLPSVRQLAATLGINPNTVSKAYTELERLRIIETIRGKGTFICEVQPVQQDTGKRTMLQEQLKTLCVDLHYYGMTRDEIVAEVHNIFDTLAGEGGENK